MLAVSLGLGISGDANGLKAASSRSPPPVSGKAGLFFDGMAGAGIIPPLSGFPDDTFRLWQEGLPPGAGATPVTEKESGLNS